MGQLTDPEVIGSRRAAIATLTAFLYNLAAALLGGIEVTLAEDEK